MKIFIISIKLTTPKEKSMKKDFDRLKPVKTTKKFYKNQY
tara:strand:+ start:53072 stop:53191 length:120 start_codon:yes stop_codon:yes gene_type:complete